MPPRSFYNSPRIDDYLAYARAFFPDEISVAKEFCDRLGRPYISNSSHIAAYLGVSDSLVRQILHRPDYHYRIFTMKKRDGRERVISTPKTYLKVIQWWILDNILNPIELSPAVHGFRRNHSYLSNALVHHGAKHILNVDIKSFFDSITKERIQLVFSDLGYDEGGSAVLSALTTRNGVTPTGAPTSPMLANLIFRDADHQLTTFAESIGLTYTRYADDLTFSSQHRISGDVLSAVSEVVSSAGFVLNKSKTKFMGRGDRQEVTGVVINESLNMPREWRNWARGFLHRVSADPASYVSERHRVRGIYGILKQLDRGHEKKLTRAARAALESIPAAPHEQDL